MPVCVNYVETLNKGLEWDVSGAEDSTYSVI